MSQSPLWTRHHRQRNTGRLIVPGLAVAVLSYFGFHAYHGEYGMNAKYQTETRIAEARQRLETTISDRKELEQRVQLLHDGTIEQDMLDEYARRTLGYTRADEVVIMIDAPHKN
jgi:cell division protein FtsB